METARQPHVLSPRKEEAYGLLNSAKSEDEKVFL
jgi:hypothetical protein